MSVSDKHMPQDYIKLCMEKTVRVQVVDDRELVGTLHAYDEHNNIIISDVIEHLMGLGETGGRVSVSQRNIDLLFVRGDRILSIAKLN